MHSQRSLDARGRCLILPCLQVGLGCLAPKDCNLKVSLSEPVISRPACRRISKFAISSILEYASFVVHIVSVFRLEAPGFVTFPSQ